MRKPVLMALIVLSLAACGPEAHPPVPVARMGRIVADMQLAEIYSTMTRRDTTLQPGVRDTDSLAAYYREILGHYRISADSFRSAMSWYMAHNDSLEAMYDQAAQRIGQLKDGGASKPN